MLGAIFADTKVTPEVMTTIINFMNNRHSKKMSVAASMIIGCVYDVHFFKLHRRTIGQKMALLGRTWVPIRPNRQTFAAHHHDALRKYLIKLDAYMNHMAVGNKEGLVFVFMDESYIHQNHSHRRTYQTDDMKKWHR